MHFGVPSGSHWGPWGVQWPPPGTLSSVPNTGTVPEGGQGGPGVPFWGARGTLLELFFLISGDELEGFSGKKGGHSVLFFNVFWRDGRRQNMKTGDARPGPESNCCLRTQPDAPPRGMGQMYNA